jgi:conjugal transfer pilus assembly protein TraE
MNHQWKNSSLQDLVKYNKWLLACLVTVSFLALILGITVVNKEDRWVIIASNDIDNRVEISNKELYPSYLKSWAIDIARKIFITSPEEVVNQHAEIRKIAASTKELSQFFTDQLQFVKGNNASSVFYAKSAVPVRGAVIVRGTLHYWFGDSPEKIALEKSYIISYKKAARGLILLSNIEENNEPLHE